MLASNRLMAPRQFGTAARSCCRARAVFLVLAKQRASPKAKKNAAPQSASVKVDHNRLYLDPHYIPEPQFGPVKILDIPGKGRGLVATANIEPGDLLLVSSPVKMVKGAQGKQLGPPELLAALAADELSNEDKFRLGLLYNSEQPSTLQDFYNGVEGLTNQKAKGFGAPKPSGASGANPPLDASALKTLSNLYSWGNTYSEIGATKCRGDDPQSFVGIWPEAALLNHSCVPNSVSMVVGGQMLVRAVGSIPAGGEITASYLEDMGSSPLGQRQQRLKSAYRFNCSCPRCKFESSLPEEIQKQLETNYQWLVGPASALDNDPEDPDAISTSTETSTETGSETGTKVALHVAPSKESIMGCAKMAIYMEDHVTPYEESIMGFAKMAINMEDHAFDMEDHVTPYEESIMARAKMAIAKEDKATVSKLRYLLQDQVNLLSMLMQKHKVPEQMWVWLRASSYATYELLFTCSDDESNSDETLPQELVPLTDVFGSSSDQHLYLTLEWLFRVGTKRGDRSHPDVEAAARPCLQAHLRRYGKVDNEWRGVEASFSLNPLGLSDSPFFAAPPPPPFRVPGS
eukprot:gene31390-6548_t